VNPACDSFVNCFHSIRGEEQDPFKIFQLAQEYTYKRIPSNIGHRSLLHKHVSFIEEENGLPVARDVKNIGKFLLGLIRLCTYLSS
jgi:hypothetical protein